MRYSQLGIIAGFLLGIVASSIAWFVSELIVRPTLDIIAGPPPEPSSGNPRWGFCHVIVQNKSWRWPWPGRRPAWSCRATIDVFRNTGDRAIDKEIQGRWISQPAPRIPVGVGNQLVELFNFALAMQGRTIDVHSHFNEPISIGLKYEGETDCYLFTNESYGFPPKSQNPDWRLGPGSYRVHVTVFYERGRVEKDFELRNEGPRLYDVHLLPWLPT
jgi:hypothetical protein